MTVTVFEKLNLCCILRKRKIIQVNREEWTVLVRLMVLSWVWFLPCNHCFRRRHYPRCPPEGVLVAKGLINGLFLVKTSISSANSRVCPCRTNSRREIHQQKLSFWKLCIMAVSAHCGEQLGRKTVRKEPKLNSKQESCTPNPVCTGSWRDMNTFMKSIMRVNMQRLLSDSSERDNYCCHTTASHQVKINTTGRVCCVV